MAEIRKIKEHAFEFKGLRFDARSGQLMVDYDEFEDGTDKDRTIMLGLNEGADKLLDIDSILALLRGKGYL